MVVAEVRRRRRGARLVEAHAHASDAHEHDHPHAQEQEHSHEHGHPHPHGDEHGHGHPHEPAAALRPGEHSHGGVRHSHLPADDRTLSWRNLFALGLAGGIIPSTNALIILLGTIVAGRAAFGIVLVVAFGLGMALVLGGVGAVMVLARDRIGRMPMTTRLGRFAEQAPLVASVAVLGIGLWLTAQALGGGTPL
jgi:ABC-type nickel/cobalt efflux system permease component RcnA